MLDSGTDGYTKHSGLELDRQLRFRMGGTLGPGIPPLAVQPPTCESTPLLHTDTDDDGATSKDASDHSI